MRVERWNEHTGGVLTESSLRRKLESMGYSVQRYVYPPGTYFAPHSHPVDKMDAVVSGRLRICMGQESVVLEAGDAVQVPRGKEHSADVMGDEPVTSLDAIRE